MKFLIVLAFAAIFCSANAKNLNKRDLRDDLLTRAKTLEESASAAIKKLNDDGRATEATHLQNEEKRLQELATQLQAATAETSIHHLEVEIRAIESRLSNELRRLGRVATTKAPLRFRRDLKDDLLKKAADLDANATAEIKKLQANNMTALAAGIEYEQKRVQEIAGELKSATGPETIRLLEQELTRSENRLAQEIRAITRDPKTKEQLLEKAIALEEQITSEVAKLKESKPTVAAFLLNQRTQLERVAVDLTLASMPFALRAAEVQLRLLETRVSEELRRLEQTSGTPAAKTTPQPVVTTGVTTVGTTRKSFVKRDLKDDLLKRVADLEVRTTAEIKKLEAGNHSELAVTLKQHETRVQAVAAELKTATGPTAIRLLEQELSLLEYRLAEEVRALEDAGLTKEQLLARAVVLEQNINTEVKKLEASGKTAVAAILHRERLQLEQIAHALTLAKDRFRIRVLEAEIRALEYRVSDELRRLEPNGLSTGTPQAQTGTSQAQTGSTPAPVPSTTAKF